MNTPIDILVTPPAPGIGIMIGNVISQCKEIEGNTSFERGILLAIIGGMSMGFPATVYAYNIDQRDLFATEEEGSITNMQGIASVISFDVASPFPSPFMPISKDAVAGLGVSEYYTCPGSA